MKVFISWSGNKSHKVALVYREWLPNVIQSIEPYVSSEDIDKGARWSSDIAKELEDSTFGILCVTKDNLEAPWLSFEAGALSKTMDKSFVSPFLFDIKRSEVDGPILQFQSTIFAKDDIQKLVRTINRACGEGSIPEARLDQALEVWYPKLEEDLNKLKETESESESTVVETTDYTSEILEEVLELARSNQKLLRSPDSKVVEQIDNMRSMLLDQRDMLKDSTEFGNRRLRKRFHPMMLEELLHFGPDPGNKYFGFLVGLSLYKNDFPWIYDAGRELLVLMKSGSTKTKKQQAVDEFRRLVEFTTEHPMIRDMFGMRKDVHMQMREMPRFLYHYLDEMK